MRLATLTNSVFPSTKYEIMVSAETSAGRGESSAIQMFTEAATGEKLLLKREGKK